MTAGRARNFAIAVLLLAVGVFAIGMFRGGDIALIVVSLVLAAASMALLTFKKCDD
ncbi:MAG TPA: hypothetical protein VML19_10275 [Verrucomicrobiae bacterium]|nr:hypothetical protein [Verrucomicrobiae bacterium]